MKRALGASAVAALALTVAGLPGTAQAHGGDHWDGGPWVGSGQWQPSFQYPTRWEDPDHSPGRWGGYRGYVPQPPTVEPPVYDEGNGSATPEPTDHPTAPAPTDPAATDPAPTDPASTDPAYTDPAFANPAPTDPSATEPAPTGSAPVPSPSAPGSSVNASGLSWPSGVYARGEGPAGIAAFAAWRGRPVDVVVDWPSRQTWDDIINPTWLYQSWQNTPQVIKAFGVAPVPEADASATMAGCAAGSYNDKWRQYGENIKAAGLDDESIIRLGWEMNGTWYKWQASDPAVFAQCWRQIVGTVEQVAPALRWDFTVNRGVGQSVADARLAYPGDEYVDVVGLDSYDWYPGAVDEAGWQAQYAGDYGIKFWADFAAAHGKKFSVPEWGNSTGTAVGGSGGGASGGDNPFYVAKMMEFFRSQGANLAYEAYFNESADYFAGAIFSPAQVPKAADQYRKSLTS